MHCRFNNIFFKLAFPNDNHLPSGIVKDFVVALISLSVANNLCHPEISVCLRDGVFVATLMPMPKTAINENGCSVFAHNYIRASRNTLYIEPVAVSVVPQPVSNKPLWLGTFCMDTSHDVMMLLFCEFMHSFKHLSQESVGKRPLEVERNHLVLGEPFQEL